MIIRCDGSSYDISAADSADDHAFVRAMLADADSGKTWRPQDLQRVANIALLARPLAVRLKEVEFSLTLEGGLV